MSRRQPTHVLRAPRTLSLIARIVAASVIAATAFVAVPVLAPAAPARAAAPTPIPVTTLADSGPGSLRAALATAESGVVGGTSYDIVFDAGLAGGTVALDSTLSLSPAGPPPAGTTVAIEGPGPGGVVALDGQGQHQILSLDGNFAGGLNVSISGVDFNNGHDALYGGGAIIGGSATAPTADTLTLIGDTFRNNSSSGPNTPGGAVQFVGGILSVSGGGFSGNSAESGDPSQLSDGGAIYYASSGSAPGQSFTASATSFEQNSSNGNGATITIGEFNNVSPHVAISNARFMDTGDTDAGSAVFAGAGVVQLKNNIFDPGSGPSPMLALGGATLTSSGDFFLGGGTPLVKGASDAAVTSTNDYWGCDSGPGAAGCASAGSASVAGFLRFAGASADATVTPGGSTTVSALFARSDGVPLTASDVPLALTSSAQLALTPSAGQVSQPQAAANNGAGASATFTAPSALGPVTIDVAVDGAHVGTIALSVAPPPAPVITTQPTDQYAAVGADATFSIDVTGSPQPVVQWQRSTDGGASWTDFGAAGPGPSSTITASSVTASDDGTRFRAVVSNTGGAVTSAVATLHVGTAPVIDVPHTVYLTSPTQTTSFTVSAAELQFVTVSPAGPHTSVAVGADGASGQFDVPAAPGATTIVTITAGSKYGTTTKQVAVVVMIAPTVTTQPSGVVTTPGQSVSFVVAGSGYPQPTVTWQVSTDGGRTFADVAGATSDTLSVTAALADDGTLYRAALTNQAGTTYSNTATLAVGVAPTLTSPTSLTAVVGQALDFPITADAGIDALDVVGTLPAGLAYDSAAHAITGTPTAAGDATVTLTAHNVFGTGPSQTLSIEVQQPAAVTQQPASATVLAGDTVTFTAAGSGFPAPAVRWQRSDDGTSWADVPGATSATLSFASAAADDGAQFRAVFTNAAGSAATAPATLTVHAPVAITSAPSTGFVRFRSGTTAQITTSGTGPITLTLSGALPAGLTFTDNGDGTATIGGTATAPPGRFPLTVTAHGFGPDATAQLMVTVTAPLSWALPGLAPVSYDGLLAGVPAVLHRGDTITVSGTGFAALSAVQLAVYSTPALLTTATTDASGAFTATVTVPDSLADGAHTMVALGSTPAGAERTLGARFTIPAAAAGSAASAHAAVPAAGALAATGAADDGGQLLIYAAVLLVAGLLVLMRRRLFARRSGRS
ncbi:beta strand repeat-containing protein [Gryllotalpicola koreensis]|uniref:Ig-like domain-containing protein n=1 Tax=Gryllotalpicola koreensis TaxID=993086 RepID=A0ABP7ZQ91_9MICO